VNLLTLAGAFFGGFAVVCVVAALLWFVIAKRNRILIGYAPVRLSAYRIEAEVKTDRAFYESPAYDTYVGERPVGLRS